MRDDRTEQIFSSECNSPSHPSQSTISKQLHGQSSSLSKQDNDFNESSSPVLVVDDNDTISFYIVPKKSPLLFSSNSSTR